MQFHKHEQSHSYSENNEQLDWKESELLAIGRIAWMEGGGKRGWRNACNISLACIAMGGGWIDYDSMAKDVKFRYMRTGRRDTFKKAWDKHETWVNSKRAMQDGDNDDNPPKRQCTGSSSKDSPHEPVAQPQAAPDSDKPPKAAANSHRP